MSQYPPVPPQPPVPPGFVPGFQQQGQYSIPAQIRTSAAAITSLVCGIIGCLVITSPIAIITGVVGLSATRNPGVKGRGMAISGLVLGILWLLLWGGVFGVVGAMVHFSGPECDFGRKYVNNLAANNIDAAVADSSDNISADDLTKEAAKMQKWGKLNAANIYSVSVKDNNGQYNGIVLGICSFSSGQTHNFNLKLIKDSSGNLKAETFVWK